MTIYNQMIITYIHASVNFLNKIYILKIINSNFKFRHYLINRLKLKLNKKNQTQQKLNNI